jgi:DNA-binding winged helix-turn-helix (wHTH) protein
MTNFRFGDYILRCDTRQLLYRATEVHLTPKALELLHTLVAQAPRAVSKTDLRNRLWAGTFVSEGNLALLITELRGVLHDDAHRPRFIRTVHGFGYAFQLDVVAESVSAPAPMSTDVTCWLVWRTQAVPLAPGRNVLGRQPGVDVVLDVPGVSRVHARITVEDGEAVLSDLGSKNGTYTNNRRVTEETVLRDGDQICIGPVIVTFRMASRSEADETLTYRQKRPSS